MAGPHFQNGILILILLNSIVLGIQGGMCLSIIFNSFYYFSDYSKQKIYTYSVYVAFQNIMENVSYFPELENMVEPWVDLVKLVFDTFDYLAMFIYVMEIILKWMDSFTDFWKSSWNVFDCVVTFMVFTSFTRFHTTANLQQH